MESPCHKWIVIRCITKYHQFGTTKRILFLGIFCGFFYHLSHQTDSIHIDTGLSRSHIHGTTHEICACQCLWNRTDHIFLCRRHPLGYQCGIATDKVHAHGLCRAIQGLCDRHIIFRALTCCGTNQCDRGNGNTLVYDRNAIIVLDLLTDFDQILCYGRDLIVDVGI